MTLRLERLQLVDWRGFATLDLPFHPQLTVLVGENGAGKTAVLEAVATALDAGFGARGSSPLDGVVREGRPSGSAALTVHAWDQPVTLTVEAPSGAATLKPHTAPGEQPRAVIEREVAVMYGTDRAVRDVTPNRSSGKVWTGEGLWPGALDAHGVRFEPFFEWFREVEDLENERRADDPSYRDPLLQSVRDAVAVVSGLGPPRVRRAGKARLVVDKGSPLTFDQLSSGERALVALAGDLAFRLAVAQPESAPADRSGVVLLDEVDQHLHPRLQREVVGRLRAAFPAVQWVVTTHSPLVAMHVDSSSVRLLRDFRLVEPPGTLGRDANTLLGALFGVPERPAEAVGELDELARLIDDGKLQEARAKLDALTRRWEYDENDPTVVEQRTLLALLG